MSAAGRLVAIEGPDGTGKSTLAGNLLRRLEQSGYRGRVVPRYCQPALTVLWHKMLIFDAATQRDAALLAAADMAVAQERIFRPALEAGEVVIADRYVYSHLVHFAARGVPRRLLEVWFQDFVVPDRILLLEAPPELTLARLAAKGKPDIWECGLDAASGDSVGRAWREFEQRQGDRKDLREQFRLYQDRLARLYIAALPAGLTHRLDARLDPDQICEKAWQKIHELLPVKA